MDYQIRDEEDVYRIKIVLISNKANVARRTNLLNKLTRIKELVTSIIPNSIKSVFNKTFCIKYKHKKNN